MKIYEYRIIMPTNVNQYQIGNLYMCAKRSKEETGNGEGIEILANEPYTKDGETGQFTHKVMHFKSRVPSYIRWAIPDKYLHLTELSYNSYPHFFTEYQMAGMGDDLYMVVESRHFEYKKTEPILDNALNLNEDELKMRKVVYLDIVNGSPKPEHEDWDLHEYVCPEANVNTPLHSKGKPFQADIEKIPDWVEGYDGEMMICIKVVKLKFHWRGIQNAVEKYALKTVYHNIFLDSHRALMRWANEWYPMDMAALRAYEYQIQEEQSKVNFDRDDGPEAAGEKPPAEGDPEAPPEKPSNADKKAKKEKKSKKSKEAPPASE